MGRKIKINVIAVIFFADFVGKLLDAPAVNPNDGSAIIFYDIVGSFNYLSELCFAQIRAQDIGCFVTTQGFLLVVNTALASSVR